MNQIYKIAKRYGKGNRARTCAAAFLAALALTSVMGMSEAQAVDIKVVNGSNINVQEAEVNGQKINKVGLNDNVLLGKPTGNNVSLSGTNGTIETTGSIATKDHIIADKGAQFGKVTISEDGKITGVAAGAVTAGSTDAVNGSQLHAVATEAAKHSKVVNGSNINGKCQVFLGNSFDCR